MVGFAGGWLVMADDFYALGRRCAYSAIDDPIWDSLPREMSRQDIDDFQRGYADGCSEDLRTRAVAVAWVLLVLGVLGLVVYLWGAI